jgi:hypothetical protein
MAFSYSIDGAADVDQFWSALPEEGRNFCVPAAWVNWMYYLARKGQLNALPFVNGQSGHIRKNIAAMGDYMDTDASDGTGSGDTLEGLEEWFGDRGMPYFVRNARATENQNIRYTSLRNLLKEGAHVVVGRGKYTLDDGEFDRFGGHALSVVGLERTEAGVITISVHNPWNESSHSTQAALRVEHVVLTEMRRDIEGDEVTILRWGPESVNKPYYCIDGWTAITPLFALSNVVAGSITKYTADAATGRVERRDFPLPFGGDIVELALDPSAPFATVIAEASGQVWTLDLVDGTWQQTPGVSGAHRLAYGGRRQRLFVATGRDIAAFDDEGNRVAALDAGVRIDALTYDANTDRMIGLGEEKLLALDPSALKVLGGSAAPEMVGDGRISISVDRRSNTLTMSRAGSPELVTAKWTGNEAAAARRIRVRTQGTTAAVHVNAKGRVFMTDDRRIATFDADGARLPGALFDGLPAGSLLKVARSNNTLDPERSRRKGWRN